jgi:GNAT superfamily N-acetyltransferase
MEVKRDNFTISTDQNRIDLEAVHAYLSESYWAKGIPRELVAKSVANSLCFGVYEGAKQIGLARVISDFATYAYLGDVYILPAFQGQGLGKWLIQTVVDHPELQEIRSFLLATRDAHGLYAQFGFEPLPEPQKRMIKRVRSSYE